MENKPTVADVRRRLMKASRGTKPSVGYTPLRRFSTGSLMLDRALGGGVPFSRITNFWGEPSQAKSSLAMIVVGAAMRQGLTVAYVDVEGTFDPLWAFKVGIENPENVLVYRPATGEEALDIINQQILDETYINDEGKERCAVDVIVLDSLGALVFQPEIDGGAGDAHVGIAARKLSTWGKVVNGKILNLDVAMITINHVTAIIGGGNYGPTETQPGGMKMRFLNSIEVRMRSPRRYPKDTSKPVQHLVIRGRTNKNKTAPPLKAFDVVVNVSDQLSAVGVDVVADLAGKSEGSGGLNYKGLLSEYGILLNKDGAPHRAGHMYYIDPETGELTALEQNTPGGKKPVGSKAALELLLYEEPKIRAMFIPQVVEAMMRENSSERIVEELEARRLQAASARLEENQVAEEEQQDSADKSTMEEGVE